jgi:hypothetical protein
MCVCVCVCGRASAHTNYEKESVREHCAVSGSGFAGWSCGRMCICARVRAGASSLKVVGGVCVVNGAWLLFPRTARQFGDCISFSDFPEVKRDKRDSLPTAPIFSFHA